MFLDIGKLRVDVTIDDNFWPSRCDICPSLAVVIYIVGSSTQNISAQIDTVPDIQGCIDDANVMGGSWVGGLFCLKISRQRNMVFCQYTPRDTGHEHPTHEGV